jgi:hypothetical protein
MHMPAYTVNNKSRFTVEEFQKLRKLLAQTELDAKLRSDYSGRAMFREQCVAFYLGRGVSQMQVISAMLEILFDKAVKFAYEAGIADETDENEANTLAMKIFHMMKDSRSDSMGLGTVVYFPYTTAEDNGAPDDEEGDDGE